MHANSWAILLSQIRILPLKSCLPPPSPSPISNVSFSFLIFIIIIFFLEKLQIQYHSKLSYQSHDASCAMWIIVLCAMQFMLKYKVWDPMGCHGLDCCGMYVNWILSNPWHLTSYNYCIVCAHLSLNKLTISISQRGTKGRNYKVGFYLQRLFFILNPWAIIRLTKEKEVSNQPGY